jgi:hypothetical protein
MWLERPGRSKLTSVMEAQTIETWLLTVGAESVEHPGGTLLAHLRRTAEVIGAWGGDTRAQCVALLHAAYGTDGFPIAFLQPAQRGDLLQLVGEAIERDVYLYGCCDRSTTYPALANEKTVIDDRFTQAQHDISRDDAERFVRLTVANELDVFAHNAQLRNAHGAWLVGWARKCSAWF